jgi:hypothetical protein
VTASRRRPEATLDGAGRARRRAESRAGHPESGSGVPRRCGPQARAGEQEQGRGLPLARKGHPGVIAWTASGLILTALKMTRLTSCRLLPCRHAAEYWGFVCPPLSSLACENSTTSVMPMALRAPPRHKINTR